jgi:hypothetical protein
MPENQVQSLAADVLATAVDKAVQLERERSDRATKLAVDLAQFKAETRHDLSDHQEHLEAINGSVGRTGNALTALKEHLEERSKIQDERNTKWDTEQAIHWRGKGQAYSKKQVTIAYIAIFATASGATIADVIKSIFG